MALYSNQDEHPSQRMMAKYPNPPLLAFWRSLRLGLSVEIIMEIVNDPERGLEKQAIDEDVKIMGPYNKGYVGCTPLLLALSAVRLDVAKALLDSGANPLVRTNYGITILHILAELNSHNQEAESAAIIRRILAIPGVISLLEHTDYRGYTPMHVAASCNLFFDTVALELLIAAGADFNAVVVAGHADFGRSPLHLAAMHRKWKVFGALIDAGANIKPVDGDGLAVLQLVINNKQGTYGDKTLVTEIKALIALGADVGGSRDLKCRSPLHFAAYDGSPDCIQALLDAGADPITANITPLQSATHFSRLEAAKALKNEMVNFKTQYEMEQAETLMRFSAHFTKYFK